MEYGSHIGEFVDYKLKELGVTKASLATKMNVTRQNLYKIIFYKNEIKLDVFQSVKKAMGEDFFDEFFTENKKLKSYYEQLPSTETDMVVSEQITGYEKKGVNKASPKITITIEIDPEGFNTEAFERFGREMSKLLKDL